MSSPDMSSPPNNIQFSLMEPQELESELDQGSNNYSSWFINEGAIEDTGIIRVIHEYETTCNVKDIVKIGEYYGVQKRMTKLKKLEMIYLIVLFENDGVNADVVLKRKQLWFYMEELKQDKFMKRFVVW